jgi:hypothetical protein
MSTFWVLFAEAKGTTFLGAVCIDYDDTDEEIGDGDPIVAQVAARGLWPDAYECRTTVFRGAPPSAPESFKNRLLNEDEFLSLIHTRH